MNDQDKAAFEAALPKIFSEPNIFGPPASFYYANRDTQFAWNAWQAALAHRDGQQPVRLTDDEVERTWQFLHDEEGNPPNHHDFASAILSEREAKAKGGL